MNIFINLFQKRKLHMSHYRPRFISRQAMHYLINIEPSFKEEQCKFIDKDVSDLLSSPNLQKLGKDVITMIAYQMVEQKSISFFEWAIITSLKNHTGIDANSDVGLFKIDEYLRQFSNCQKDKEYLNVYEFKEISEKHFFEIDESKEPIDIQSILEKYQPS